MNGNEEWTITWSTWGPSHCHPIQNLNRKTGALLSFNTEVFEQFLKPKSGNCGVNFRHPLQSREVGK